MCSKTVCNSSCGRCARSWQHCCFYTREGGLGILVRSRCLGAKLLVCVWWHYLRQNSRLQCVPEAHWPRTLPIWGKGTIPSLPKGSWVSQRGGLIYKLLVTLFFPFRSSSLPDHNSMASKDTGSWWRWDVHHSHVICLLLWGFPAVELSIPLSRNSQCVFFLRSFLHLQTME